MTNHQNAAVNHSRPGWVWAIFLYKTFGLVTYLYMLWKLQSGSFPAEVQEVMNSFGKWHYIMGTINLVVGYIGVIALFMLRKIAYQIFWAHLLLVIIMNVFLYNPAVPIFPIIFGLCFFVLVLFYTRNLIKRGVLH